MDSAAKESIVPDRLSERLGGLILKDKQRLAVEALMSGKDVLAVLPTGFGKSVIYRSFVIAKDSSSIIVIVPLRSIIDDQLQSKFCCVTFFIKLFARSSSMSFFLSPDGKCKLTSTSRDVDFSQRLESISMTRSGNSPATVSQYCCAFPNKSGRFAPRFCPVSFDAFSLSAFLLFSLLKPGLDFEHLLNLSVSSFSSSALSWKL